MTNNQSKSPVRELKCCTWTVERNISYTTLETNFEQWIETKAQDYRYLLAHADNGLIWGRVDDGKIKPSNQAFPDVSPALTPVTLQQLRLFGAHSELHLWRTEPGHFRGRVITDGKGNKQGTYFDEAQILWGNRWVDEKETFTMVKEGQRGLRHAFPNVADKNKFGTEKNPKHPLRLKLRHYLTHDDETGQARIYLSRLVDVEVRE